MTRDERHQWHVAINRYVWPKDGPVRELAAVRWMYEAKEVASEVPRLTVLHQMERCGELPKLHRHCSHSAEEPVPDNHLTCCLGVKCRACPELTALSAMQASPEAIDEAKAWTCATHIISKGGDWAREGYLMTVDDRMYWDRVYASMAMANPDGSDDDSSSDPSPSTEIPR